MKAVFDVGSAEVHTIVLSTGIFNGKIVLSVDGKPASRTRFRVWIPSHRRVEILVGNQERHEVAVDVQFGKWARKTQKPRFVAYVDGEAVASN